MTINSMNDAQDPYEYEEYSMGGNVQVGNVETETNGRRYKETSPYIVATMRSLRVGLQICREDNERMIKT